MSALAVAAPLGEGGLVEREGRPLSPEECVLAIFLGLQLLRWLIPRPRSSESDVAIKQR